VLAAAYAGTAEQGWDLERFEERRRLPWFRPEDLLVAELDDSEDGPALAGLHWLKRRDERTGEVYNLAVHPDAQGHRWGRCCCMPASSTCASRAATR
jgi:mycothiol synthase